jgi:hypothetical protein
MYALRRFTDRPRHTRRVEVYRDRLTTAAEHMAATAIERGVCPRTAAATLARAERRAVAALRMRGAR